MRLIQALGIIMAMTTFASVNAEIRTEIVEYKEGDTVLEGFIAFDAKSAAKRPGILVVPNWMGVNAQAKESAEKLAKMGYTAFVADVYGKGVRPKDMKEAGAQATKYRNDRPLFRKRMKAAYDTLAKHKTVDGKRMGAMGYCFGGQAALELARTGADLKGVVSFHGALNTPTPDDAKNIKGRVLALHGAEDPFVPATEVGAFEEEMRKGGVQWELVKYSGAVHSFTDKDAGNDPKKGQAYNKIADRRSWASMTDFWKATLAKE